MNLEFVKRTVRRLLGLEDVLQEILEFVERTDNNANQACKDATGIRRGIDTIKYEVSDMKGYAEDAEWSAREAKDNTQTILNELRELKGDFKQPDVQRLDDLQKMLSDERSKDGRVIMSGAKADDMHELIEIMKEGGSR